MSEDLIDAPEPLRDRTTVRKTAAARWFIVGLFALNVYFLLQVLQLFFTGIAWALVLATAFYPVYTYISKKFRGRDWMAAIFTSILVALLIIGPAFTIVNTVTDMLPEIMAHVRGASDGFSLKNVQGQSTPFGRLLESIESIGTQYLPISEQTIRSTILTSLGKIGQTLASQSRHLVQNAFRTILGFCVMLFTMTVLFRDGRKIFEFVRKSLPLTEEDKSIAFGRLEVMVRAVFYGVIMTAAVQGLALAIGWLIVGLPKAVFFGMATFFAAMVPVAGTMLVWAPGAFYLFMHGETLNGIILVLWGVLVVGMVDNVFRPIFISGKTRLHLLLVFFGIFGGLTAFGPVGLFLGPLLLTLFFFLLEVIRRDLFPAERIPVSES